MAIKLGTTGINKVYLGANEMNKVYLGSTEVYGAAPVVNNNFDLTVETTTTNESFLLPLTGVTSIDVDWGDGTVDTGITSDNPTHTYATAGTHSISVSGSATSVAFNGSGSEGKLRTVTNLGALGWTSFVEAFRNCSSMTSFECGDTDTSNVTTMYYMFNGCGSATTIDVSGFDTSSVTTMGGMFWNCLSITTIDVSGFNTSIVTNLGGMFRGCSSITTVDVSGWDTSNVTALSLFGHGTFEFCSSLANIDIDGWNVTSLTYGVDFLGGANNALTTVQYDAVLIAWAAQAVQSNVTIHFGDAKYTAGGAAEAARTTLVSIYGWTITDGGAA